MNSLRRASTLLASKPTGAPVQRVLGRAAGVATVASVGLRARNLPGHVVGRLCPAAAGLPQVGSVRCMSAQAAVSVDTEAPRDPLRTTISFKVADEVGTLDNALSLLRNLRISLSRIESRPSRTKGFYDIYVDFNARDEEHVQHICSELRGGVVEMTLHSMGPNVNDLVPEQSVPWFPRKKSDMDTFAEKVMEYGAELDADHPGFKDPVYRERRAEITRIAKTYRYGEKLPHIEYTAKETETWGVVYKKLTALYKTHACREFQYVFPLLEHNCKYAPDNIPQLEDVSRFLKESTGFTLRPVMGLLSSRDFLNALAFRVFHSTQYIRHHSEPLYTPEPDVCHELLGHIPLYADPDFADFSQEIGLASLGASDEDIEALASIYWFTVEFGLVKQGKEVKAYGAGLLSSFGELQYALSDKPTLLPFEPAKAAVQKYPITEYQPVYFVAESFKDMKEQVKDYALDMRRPFTLRYNALSETVEVLDTKDKLLRYAAGIRSDLGRLMAGLERVTHH